MGKQHSPAPQAIIQTLPPSHAAGSGSPDPYPPNTSTIAITGPVLASAELLSSIHPEVTCVAGRLLLTATIRRASSYPEAALGSFLAPGRPWQPVMTLRIPSSHPALPVQAIWKLLSEKNVLLDRASTPAYPEQRYPIVLEKTIR